MFLLGVVMALMSVCAYADSDSLQDDDLFFGINFFRSQEEIEESGIDFIPSPYFGPYSDMHTIEGRPSWREQLFNPGKKEWGLGVSKIGGGELLL